MSESEKEDPYPSTSDRNLREAIRASETGQCNNSQGQNYTEAQLNYLEVSTPNKRGREEDDMDWTVVGSNGKKVKEDNIKIEVYISSSEKLPKQFGLAKIFKEQGIIDTLKIKYINPYRIRIEFNNELSAEKFITCDKFASMGWRISKSMEVGYSYGIIKNVDLDLGEEQILEDIVCPSPAKLVSLKRLNRRNDNGDGWIPSESVRLCFKGYYLPAYACVGNLKVKIEKYVFPVSQCSRCWKLGHISKKCESKVVCPKCSGNHANCDTKILKCPNCSGEHIALSKECPSYKKERRIRLIMADFNCTYRKALTMYPTDSPSNSPLPASRVLSNTQASKPIDTSPATPSFADVVKEGSHNKHLSHPKTTPKKKENAKPKRTTREFNVKNWNVKQSDTESENSETNNPRNRFTKRAPDGNVTIIELVRKIKEVIFSKRDTMSVKIQSIVKLCTEWLIIWLVGNISEWSLFKRLFDFSLASDNDSSN